jgi:serine/threonine protein kinase
MAVGELRPPAPTDDPLVGRVISERYRVIRKLGEGGMGAVYLAEHVFIEKKVALKVLASELSRREDLAKRFLQEAKSASRIGHENIIDISDFGQTEDGLVFFAMEYLDGVDLGALVRQHGALPWSRAKPIVMQICKALRAAHAQGIVHRDMKPENIFVLQREGRPDFIKLLDFGIAKVTGGAGMGDEGPRLTRTGMIFGTPEYMAPEQAEGKPADHRVDIYATGCVIYHCITGVTPFQADSFMAMLTKHLLEDPIAPSARRPDLDISPELDEIILRSLEKNREQRWQTMDEIIVAVAACEASDDAADDDGEAVPRKSLQSAVTKHIGGGENQPVVRSSRKSDTEVFGRGGQREAQPPPRATRPKRSPSGMARAAQQERPEETDLVERPEGLSTKRPTPARTSPANRGGHAKSGSSKGILLVGGILVGVIGAAAWAWHSGKIGQQGQVQIQPPIAPPAEDRGTQHPPSAGKSDPAAQPKNVAIGGQEKVGGTAEHAAGTPSEHPVVEKPATPAPETSPSPPPTAQTHGKHHRDRGDRTDRSGERANPGPGAVTAPEAPTPPPAETPPPSGPKLKKLELLVPKQFEPTAPPK